jgi:hypothetical protein
MNVLAVNLPFSTLVFWIPAKLYLLPRLLSSHAKAAFILRDWKT